MKDQKVSTALGTTILIIIAATVAGFILICFEKYPVKDNVRSMTAPEKELRNESSKDQVMERYDKMQLLIDRDEYESVYDDYYSYKSKIKISRERFLRVNEVMKKHDIRYDFNIKAVHIDSDLVHIDRILTKTYSNGEIEKERGYETFSKIDGEWFYEIEPIFCIRKEPYEMSSDLHNAMDLIISSYEESNYQTLAKFYKKIRNCVHINYVDAIGEYKQLSAAFEYHPMQSLEKNSIVVNSKYRGHEFLLAVILSHELKHIEQYTIIGEVQDEEDCFAREADALIAQGQLYRILINNEELKQESHNDLYQNFSELGDLFANMEGYNKNDIINEIKKIQFYKEQCHSFL